MKPLLNLFFNSIKFVKKYSFPRSKSFKSPHKRNSNKLLIEIIEVVLNVYRFDIRRILSGTKMNIQRLQIDVPQTTMDIHELLKFHNIKLLQISYLFRTIEPSHFQIERVIIKG